MIKIINFLKKYWFIILVFLVLIFVVVDKIIIPDKKTSQSVQTITSNRVVDYKSIQPGITTSSEVNKILGKPIKQNEIDGKILEEFASSNKYRNNTVIVQNGVATLIKEIITSADNKRADDFIREFGTAPNKLYGQDPNSNFNLYVYPINGIAYLGHEDGTLLEIWYFQPTNIGNFMSIWATDYSTEKSSEILKY